MSRQTTTDQTTTDQTTTDQALHDRICGYFTPVERAAVVAAGDAIAAHGSGPEDLSERLADRKVMVAYGGGKDSSYVVAFVRAVQLSLAIRHGQTFTLRVANMRHGGVPHAVMANIDRVYGALGMLDDDRAELLTIDHTEVRRFDVDLPLPRRLLEQNRLDILMNGHRSQGDGRPTFCNSCNLAVADFYGRAAWWAGGVDIIMTGDSRREQVLYSAWILRLARNSGVDVEALRSAGFQGLLTVLQGIGDVYFRELFGPDDEAVAQRRISVGDGSVQPEFVSIYDLVSYRVDDHWDLIVDFLGFRFDDLAFSFTESDCANPTLMAHLRGLRAEQVEGRTYAAGIGEYLQFAELMMRAKEMPQQLIDLALERYDSPARIEQRREVAASYAFDVFGLSEDALVAMVFSPFTDRGSRLEQFVGARHRDRSPDVQALHAVLAGGSDAIVEAWLESVSGLPLDRLRTLYGSSLVDFSRGESMLSLVRAGDPHKAHVTTVDQRSGEATLELISGR